MLAEAVTALLKHPASSSSAEGGAGSVMIGRNRLATRVQRLEEHSGATGNCGMCGDQRLLILPADEDGRERFVGDACRGCGQPTKLLRGIDWSAV